MPRVFSKRAGKPYKCGKSGCQINKGIIVKGDTYLFYFQRYSKTSRGVKKYRHTACRPTRSELTGSEFLQAIYGAEDSFTAQVADLRAKKVAIEEFEQYIDDAVSELEQARDGCEERREAMPEGLQDSETGQLLEERMEKCNDTISELEELRDKLFELRDADEDEDADENGNEGDDRGNEDEDEGESPLEDFCTEADNINWPE